MRRLYSETIARRRSLPQRLRAAWRALTMQPPRGWIGTWRRNEKGTSAVEFALFAPVLFFALVATVDVGLAEYERMTIDHILRAGAQSAMADQGQDQILKIVQNTASRNFTLSNQTTINATALAVAVDRFCACPDSPTAAVACTTTCTGLTPTFVYYRVSAAKIYTGMIMPAITMSPSVLVQVR
jgi:pilus assembly protein CpaE